MNTIEKIGHIRKLMQSRTIDALVVPSDDPHKSEYVAEHWQARKWLTGFSGSAGTAVVTSEKAILWTDFRYFIQAEKQLKGSGFELFRTGEQDVPSSAKWLKDNLKPESVVGIDANVFSTTGVRELKKEFDEKGIRLNTSADILSQVWTDRPPRPQSRAFGFSESYTGQGRKDKISLIREKMKIYGATLHVLSTLDDIAWTLNLRGKDVHTNPVNIAYALISHEKVFLFIDNKKIDQALEAELNRDGIEIKPYEGIHDALTGLEKGKSILIDPENINFRLYEAIPAHCKIIEKPNPSILMKAIKNQIQISHLRQTAIKDGVAVVKFLYWMEHRDEDEKTTELSAAEKIFSFRREQACFIDNSFDSIMAYHDHSAMCHYSASKDTDAVIGRSGMFLADTGGNYLTGTTDITRTLCLGKPSPEEKRDYTLVMKGHIAVAEAVFPADTRGFQIDTLARQYLWKQGMNFGHGTGHGVGFFLCVHEGPARISPNPIDVKLEKGMLLTNEPGIYREGRYGIRLENMILVADAFENEFGKFMKFENLTWCHFERDLLDKTLLSYEEIKWIDLYHQRVYEMLSPELDRQTKAWLKEKTRPISGQ
ncbi:MAG: Xaa-Pro aminopeptidase [Desulfobacterales bacterium RIFOXYA12_FULL_46_15]|nr:MAG: Xaa-Pro aminopeptidase [Desulfobacterales bacterium RIFOXYA12_FULL_46_15]